MEYQPRYVRAPGGASIWETRTIDGHPALVRYSPAGDLTHETVAYVFDESSGIEYLVVGVSPRVSGSADKVIAIARSLYRARTPTATAAATPARYDRLDATGAVAAAGSWAILGADGGVLTDWEDLRGSAAALRVHRNDASGASRAAAWGAVEAGDLVEWRKADDCWVRYLVTGAPAPPASGSSRWEFPVEWMTYAATGAGCTGAVGARDRPPLRRGRMVRHPGVSDHLARAPRAVPGLSPRLDGRAGVRGVAPAAGSRRGGSGRRRPARPPRRLP